MRVATASYAATAAGVRAVIAAYAQAVDDGRHGDIAAMFCEDGSVDMLAAGVVVGREALYALFHGGPPPSLSRHVLTSTHVPRWTAAHAVAISDLVVVGRGEGRPGASGRWAGISTCRTAGTDAGASTRGHCGSPMTPRRCATPASAPRRDHRKAS